MSYDHAHQQENGIEVRVYASPGGQIVFDLTEKRDHRRSSFGQNKLYQNLTVKEAKALRKTLKRAIEAVTQ
ncbi:hypothetical protein ABZ916_25600 [Streptomyces sp. NPDC046853]|uniref:hypothetical protein n=1 Tax=Streptomyces sp. NPDC046853 TaxID=3154920 RepID=UPI0034063FC9